MPPEYEDKIINFHRYVINLRKENNFELSQIANVDEVPLTFNVPSNKSVESKGAKSVTYKTTLYFNKYMLKHTKIFFPQNILVK